MAIAATAGGITLLGAAEMLVLAAVGGAIIGLAIAVALHRMRRRLQPVLENALALFVPFVAFLAAEVVHASGVIAVVVAGLYLSRTSTASRSATRLQGWSTWQLIAFVLEAVVFLLIGLQLPAVLRGLQTDAQPRRSARLVAGDPRRGHPRPLRLGVSRHLSAATAVASHPGARPRASPWTYPAVVSWAGMRGVVSSRRRSRSPSTSRNAIHPVHHLRRRVRHPRPAGADPALLIRRLGVVGREDYTDRLAEANAQYRAVRAGLERLDELLADETTPPHEDIVDKLRTNAEHRSNGAWERISGSTANADESPTAFYRRLRTEMIRAERDEFVRLRDNGELDDEVLRVVVRDLDSKRHSSPASTRVP